MTADVSLCTKSRRAPTPSSRMSTSHSAVLRTCDTTKCRGTVSKARNVLAPARGEACEAGGAASASNPAERPHRGTGGDAVHPAAAAIACARAVVHAAGGD